MATENEISTRNDFWIGSDGQSLSAMMPVRCTSREQAFRTAAYLCIMGGMLPSEHNNPDEQPSFEDIRQAVLNT